MNRIAEVESFSVIVPGDGDTIGSKKIWLPKSSAPKNVSLLEASIKWCLGSGLITKTRLSQRERLRT